MSWDTAEQIITDAAVEVGLGYIPAAYTSDDPNCVQLRYLLKSGGREIAKSRNWTHLRKEHTFTTVQGVSAYQYPADFHSMISQTWWNRTNRLPLGGPLSPQEWQYLKSRLTGVVFTVLFRPFGMLINLYPDTNTPGGYEIAFEYQSLWWTGLPTATIVNPYTGVWAESTAFALGDTVGYGATGNAHWIVTTEGTSSAGTDPLGTIGFPTAPANGTTTTDGSIVWTFVSDTSQVAPSPSKEYPTLGTDIVYLDSGLMVRKLKLDFLKAKGFDTTSAQRDFDLAYDEEAGNDSDSPILTAHKTTQIDPLLGGQSIPFTGFGS